MKAQYMHRIRYVRSGAIFGVKCVCGATLLLDTAQTNIQDGADLEEIMISELHRSAQTHYEEKNCHA